MSNDANPPEEPEPEEPEPAEGDGGTQSPLTRSDLIALIGAGLGIFAPIIFLAVIPARFHIWAAILGLLLWFGVLYLARNAVRIAAARYSWRTALVLLLVGLVAGVATGHYAWRLRQVVHIVKVVHRVKLVDRKTPKTPDISVLTTLISEEALASVHHNVGRAVSIYAPGAVINDAGCQIRGGAGSFTGNQITTRYQVLRKFSWLQHVNVHGVTWTPDSPQATRATALSESIGLIEPRVKSHDPQFIASGDKWTFAKINGKWLITSFTYNRCIVFDGGG